LGDCNTHTNQYSESYTDHESLPGPKKSREHESGNEDVNISILSLINHYTAFSETIKGNSATTRAHNAISMNNTHPSYPKDPIISIPNNIPELLNKNPSKQFTIAAMPAYNEEKYIAKTIINARKYVDKVLVVDDYSSDSTNEIATALGAIVVRHPENRGYGGALQTIFNKAREVHADKLVILDSDGQHDPQFIPELLKPLDAGYDLVIGSRFLSTDEKGIPSYRIVGMKVLDTATKFAGEINISDSQSGFRAYGKKAIECIKVSGNGMSAGSEILLQIKDHDLRFTEVPIKVRYDLEDTSSQNPVIHGVSVLNAIVGMLGYRRPLLSFGIPGICITAIGIIAGSWAFSAYYTNHMLPFGPTFLSGIAIMAGLLLITTALILNSLVQIVKMERGS